MVTVRRLEQEGREYYYLEYPVKIDGRVKKYSKYLGREIPENVEELKKQFQFEINSARWSLVSQRAKEKRDSLISKMSKEELEQFHHDNALSFTANSLRIEGSALTQLELKRLVEDSVVPKWRKHDEIKMGLAHYEIVSNFHRNKPDFSFDLLVDWHWKLFRESKPAVAGLVKNKTDGQWIDDLEAIYKEYGENADGVLKAGVIHYAISRVAPFLEGNEIMARLAMNCILLTNDFPMLDIKFNERVRYENAIERSIKKEDEKEFLKWYFLKFSRSQ